MARRLCLISIVYVIPVFGTVIVQKNGDVISGKILQEKPEKYIFQSPYGTLQIAKSEVQKLIRDEKTIELQSVAIDGKTVKARLVNQENNTSTYLTEDGRTLRKEQEAVIPAKTPESSPERRDSFLINASGFYGLANFQQVSESPPAAGSAAAPLDQAIRPNALGVHAGFQYAWLRYFGPGVFLAYNRWSGPTSVTGVGSPVTYDAQTSHTSFFLGATLAVSPFGKLGVQNAAHDFRLELSPGFAFNSSDTNLTFKTSPPGFPPSANANASSRGFALQTTAQYVYAVSESLRLRLGLGYYRIFNDNLFGGGQLQGSPSAVPGQFRADFDNNLARAGEQVGIYSLLVGFEIGF